MQIAGREISSAQPPYIIAEISGNHAGDENTAHMLIAAAKQTGANAVKFQAYTPDTITIDCNKPDFLIHDGPWKGRKLYELYEKAHTPFAWFPALFAHCRRIGITPLASVFDKTSVDMLEALECPAYKIASMEITDTPLIGYAASTEKPMIISTGMASNAEIMAAHEASMSSSGVAFLHCISGYPTPIEEANLRKLGSLFSLLFGTNSVLGISDHTLGWEIPVAATVLSQIMKPSPLIIEKHLKLGYDSPVEDADFSLVPSEFKLMVEKVRQIWQAMQPSEAKSEQASRQLRRSLYVTQDMKMGDKFNELNLRSIRPGYGGEPKMLPDILGKRAACDIPKGTPFIVPGMAE